MLMSPQDKAAPSYKDLQAKWRADYQERLLRPQGWFSVAGLFWLNEGDNAMGSAPGSPVLLPSYASPAVAGTLTLTGRKVTLKPAPGVDLKVNDQPATEMVLSSDASNHTDKLSLGGVTFKVIERTDKIGIRLYDPQCEGRTKFKSLHWYKIDPKMVVKAQFVPYDPPRKVNIANVLGQQTPTDLPGYLVFTIDGKECRLDAQDSGDTLFLDFQDATSGKETYGAGRFLDTEKPKDGVVMIDFNQATNPPCAYTAFATCPLPPAGNRLSVAIKAGEKGYHH